jgi:hypothetical protein
MKWVELRKGKRRRGRPKMRWRDKVEEVLGEKGWRKEEVLDRLKWGSRIRDGNADPK